MTKRRKGNVSIALLIALVVIIILGITIYHFRNIPSPTPKQQVFYGEPAGTDTRLPTQEELDNPPNSPEDINAVKSSPTIKYSNALYGIQFSYPQYWGKINLVPDSQKLDSNDPLLKSCLTAEEVKNLDKVSNPITLNFDSSKCGNEGCGVTINVYIYDNNHHYALSGYEGYCAMEDLYSTESKIKADSNIKIGGHLATITDSFFPPSRSNSRLIRILFPGRIVEVSAWYQPKNYKLFSASTNSGGLYLDNLVTQHPDDPIYTMLGLFLKDLRSTVESLTI